MHVCMYIYIYTYAHIIDIYARGTSSGAKPESRSPGVPPPYVVCVCCLLFHTIC